MAKSFMGCSNVSGLARGPIMKKLQYHLSIEPICINWTDRLGHIYSNIILNIRRSINGTSKKYKIED